jgi:mRNA interferase MazF
MVVPKRGHIFEVNFNPARGSEQAGIRPALVVQNDIGNASSPTTVVVAITSKMPKKRYPFDVWLAPDLLPKPSVVKCDQLMTVANERLGKMMGVVPEEGMREVDEALRRSLQL